eukprot:7599055-Alexandrium_andersonii.AAC.1
MAELLETGGGHPPAGLHGRGPELRPPERAADGGGELPQRHGGLGPWVGGPAARAPAGGARQP